MEQLQNMYAATNANLEQVPQTDDTYVPKLLSFSGRIGRLRYLAYQVSMAILSYLFLFAVAGLILATSSFSSISQTLESAMGMVVLTVFAIALFVGSITIAKRRLNDLDNSGWLAILMFIPYVNFLFSLYLIFAKGNEGSNSYGPAPSANTRAVILGALVMPILAVLGIIAAIALPAYKNYTDRVKAHAYVENIARDHS